MAQTFTPPASPFKKGMAFQKNLSDKEADSLLLNYVFANDVPSNPQLEEVVLGAIILSAKGEQAQMVFTFLKPQVFYVSIHAVIFQILFEIQADSAPIDLLTVVEYAKKTNRYYSLDNPHGVTANLIVGLTSKVTSGANLEYHARLLVELYKSREMQKTLSQGIKSINEKEYGSTNDAAADIMAKIQNITAENEIQTQFTYESFQEILIKKISGTYGEIGLFSSMITQNGLPFFTYEPTDMISIVACPGHGKTSFAVTEMLHFLIKGKKVHYYSLEESEYQIWCRIVAQSIYILTNHSTIISFGDIMRGNLSEEQQVCIDKAAEFISPFKANLRLFPTLENIEMCAMNTRISITRKEQPDAIFIDQFSHVGYTGKNMKTEELSHISRNVKSMAKTFKIPHFLCAQINEKSTKGALPKASDIKDCGSVYDDSDICINPYRRAVYDETDSEVLVTALKYRADEAHNTPYGVQYIGAASYFYNNSPDPFTSLIPPMPPPLTPNPNRNHEPQTDGNMPF